MLFVLFLPLAVTAGWMGFQNNTQQTIVIQETLIVNNKPKLGKPQKLFQGDTVRDTQVCPNNTRQFTIYDSKGNIIHTETFTCPKANENHLHVVQMDKNGKITFKTIQTMVTVTPMVKK